MPKWKHLSLHNTRYEDIFHYVGSKAHSRMKAGGKVGSGERMV